MKITKHKNKGVTLIELTIVIAFGLVLSSAGMLLLTQQINMAQRFRDQNFILEEAPKINTTFNSLLSQAIDIRLYPDFATAIGAAPTQNSFANGAVLNGSTVLVASYPNPATGNLTFGIISLDMDANGNNVLNYYVFDRFSVSTPVQNSPSWTISRRVSNVNFQLMLGLFDMTLTGPNAGTITYTISPNR